MKKFIYIIFISILFIAFYESCSKVESDDIPPKVSELRLNLNDTVGYKKDTVIINKESNKNPDRIDTLVIGKPIYFRARFQDNDNGLSSYRFEILPTKELENSSQPNLRVDTVFRIVKSGSIMFNKSDTLLKKIYVGDIMDSISVTLANGSSKGLLIKEGNYYLKLDCVDKFGNIDSTSYNRKIVRLFYPKTIVESRKKK